MKTIPDAEIHRVRAAYPDNIAAQADVLGVMPKTLSARLRRMGIPPVVPAHINPKQAIKRTVRDRTREKLAAYLHEATGRHQLRTLPGQGTLALQLRKVPGGRLTFIGFVQSAALNGSEIAQQFLYVFQRLTLQEQKQCSLDDVCDASGVLPQDLVGIVCSEGVRMRIDISEMIRNAAQPDVVAAMVQSATRTDGDHADIALKDRLALLQSSGFLPAPRGTTIHVAAQAHATAQAASATAHPSVPRFADDMQTLSRAQQRARTAVLEGTVTDRDDP
jgi:hypothetical protein